MQESLQEIEDTPGGSSSSDIMPLVANEMVVPIVETEIAEGAVVAVPIVENRDNECCVCMVDAADSSFRCSHKVCGFCYQKIMSDAARAGEAATCPLCRDEQFFQPPPLRFPDPAMPLLYPGWFDPSPETRLRLETEANAELLAINQRLATAIAQIPVGPLPNARLAPIRRFGTGTVARDYIYIGVAVAQDVIDLVPTHGYNNFTVEGLRDNLASHSTVKEFKKRLAGQFGISYSAFLNTYEVVVIAGGAILGNNRVHLASTGLNLYSSPGSACTVRILRKSP